MTYAADSPFETLIGPFDIQELDGSISCVVHTGEPHQNSAGTIHGGTTMAFAHTALLAFARHQLGIADPHVISFNADFVAAARPGETITSHDTLLSRTGSLAYTQGLLKVDDRVILNYSGVIADCAKEPLLAKPVEGFAGVPEGFQKRTPREPSEATVGAFFINRLPDDYQIGFKTEAHHADGLGHIHGGLLLSFADSAIAIPARGVFGKGAGVTLTFNADFPRPGRPGDFVECVGNVVGSTENTAFIRACLMSGDQAIMNFSLVLRKAVWRKPKERNS